MFDVSDTEPLDGAAPLPSEVTNPFKVRSGRVGHELHLICENAKRDGVNILEQQAGTQSAGSIQVASSRGFLNVLKKSRPKKEFERVPLRYEMLLNSKFSREEKFATVAHELGHLYCGHLGSPNVNWWPDRHTLNTDSCEFEAESVCYLVCSRLGIDNPSDEYLAAYLRANKETPPISLEAVMKAAGLLEKMGRELLRPRKVSQ